MARGRKVNYQEGYKKYKERYTAKEKQLNKKGFEMNETMYSFTEYKQMYIAQKNDVDKLNEKIKSGTITNRKIEKNINRLLVEKQAYKFNLALAKSLQKELKQQLNKNATLMEIRTDNVENVSMDLAERKLLLKPVLDKRYNELVAEGISKNEIKHILSTEIFGSP